MLKKLAAILKLQTRCSCDKIDDVRVCTYCVFTNFMKSECHTGENHIFPFFCLNFVELLQYWTEEFIQNAIIVPVSDCGRFRLNRHRRSINSISKYEASAIGFKKRETVAEVLKSKDQRLKIKDHFSQSPSLTLLPTAAIIGRERLRPHQSANWRMVNVFTVRIGVIRNASIGETSAALTTCTL